jgi:hypothetical protein
MSSSRVLGDQTEIRQRGVPYENLDFCRLFGGWTFPRISSGYCSSHMAWRNLFRKLQWLHRHGQLRHHYVQLPQAEWHERHHVNQFCKVHWAIIDQQ